jgi:hypothetical protein
MRGFYGVMGVGKNRNEIQGSLYCGGKSAAFGRDDVCGWLYRIDTIKTKTDADPYGMTNKRAGNGDCNSDGNSNGNGKCECEFKIPAAGVSFR